jgi:serine/threonine-protein kinase
MLAGRFRIERVLGRGGMGEVMLALDTLLGRRVAVKLLRADGASDLDERRSAILKEARRASQVDDRRIAAIHDVVDLGRDLLIVMEFVDGETLRTHLRGPLPMERFWDLSRQCLEALGVAHTRGVIHRDIKPENLMLTRANEIKILDFGLAWRAMRPEGSASLGDGTATTEIPRGPAGTLRYMAPEAHYGGRIDERTDLFSLGVVFYEMLTGVHPFAGDSQERVIDLIMNTPARPASEMNPAVSPELSRVVERMLERDPAQRFASCADARAALLAAKRASGVALTAAETLPIAPPGAGARAAGARARRRWLWVAAGAALAFSGGVLWRAAVQPRLPTERRLAMMPPATPGASEDFAAYALGATELLAVRLTRLQDWPGFQMSTFAESYSEKLTSPADARRALGANLVLVPTLEQRGNRLRARLELREPARERLLDSRSVDVALAEPFVFADSLYHSALAMLRLPKRAQSAQADVGVRGAGTLRFLLQGIGRRRAATTTEARQRALEDFETAYRTEPDPAAPRAWRAAAQVSMFNATKDTAWLVRAEASAREAVSLDRSRSEAHRTLAGALTIRRRFAEALEEYRIASALEPTDDDAWHLWGRTWQRLGRPEEERKVYVTAIARRPHAFKPRWWLASWEYNNGHIEEAVVAYREMIRRSPEFATGYSSLGGLLLFRGSYTEAVDTLRLAVELRPSAMAFSNLGTAYFSSGHLGQAVDAYNQAFQFGDADHVLWMNLGDAYFWLRDRPDQARDAYRQAVRLGREHMAVRLQRGSAPDPMIPALLASVLPKLGQPDSARVMLREALALDSLNSRVQYQAALTEWQLGERGRALDWLRRAVAGGFPMVWLRDSPVHRDWREEPGFQSLLASVPTAKRPETPGKGGGR